MEKSWKKVKSLLNIKFNSEPLYDDNDKYIKTKIKTYSDSFITNFQEKNAKRKCTIQVFTDNNARFCYQSKEKVSSSNTFGRVQIWTKKIKMVNLIDDNLEKSSSDESGS